MSADRIFDTKADRWTYREPMWSAGATYDGRPKHRFLGPCPVCGGRTFDYGGGWRCLDDRCVNSAGNPAPTMGPEPAWWSSDVQVYRDGDQWCAVRGDFTNLQESDAGFGATPHAAVEALLVMAANEVTHPTDTERADVAKALREAIEKSGEWQGVLVIGIGSGVDEHGKTKVYIGATDNLAGLATMTAELVMFAGSEPKPEVA